MPIRSGCIKTKCGSTLTPANRPVRIACCATAKIVMSPDSTNPQQALPPPLPGVPDWNAIGAEILCPLCEYNLRGLAEPRCPECGYQFVWSEILTAQQHQHPYLFEHGRGRRGETLRRTLVAGLFPETFWRELKPVQIPHVRWLWIYFAVVMLVGLAAAGIAVASIEQYSFLAAGSAGVLHSDLYVAAWAGLPTLPQAR